MRKATLAVIGIGLAIYAFGVAQLRAEEQTRLYDARGNSIATAAPQGNGSVRYYDARGNSLGTSATTGGVTRFYSRRWTYASHNASDLKFRQEFP
jgi:YD repeat-containing protein